MLYCLAVKGNSVNRPGQVVEWRGLGRAQWALEEGTDRLVFGPFEGWRGLRWPSHDPARNRAASASNTKE